ncbi:cell growth regulator with RING finger domain protein 1 isoform X2 [Struthio camelus]|uniref:cell growth regulator with RING finger domain protein 1 isoform X2 n=1 Tax=Struthio camelus TaxID=8801 RepID=UPI003603C48E
MAAVFLVTLYEYSPLFYITVVFVCFLVTSGLVLGWFGLGVPVILRNSEETESSTRVLKKQMRQVKNPFGLEISRPSAASVTKGITLTPDCLEDCILTCYWGCSVQKLHEALQKHVYCFRIKTPQALEDALYSEYLYRQQYFIKKNDKEEKYCQLPEDAQVVDFGPVPRSRYPLIALLTLADEEDREIYDIISMVAVIHIPDESYRLSCRMLFQYLLLAQGQYHDLKQLFMSANSTAPSSSDTSPGEGSTDRRLLEKMTAELWQELGVGGVQDIKCFCYFERYAYVRNLSQSPLESVERFLLIAVGLNGTSLALSSLSLHYVILRCRLSVLLAMGYNNLLSL